MPELNVNCLPVLLLYCVFRTNIYLFRTMFFVPFRHIYLENTSKVSFVRLFVLLRTRTAQYPPMHCIHRSLQWFFLSAVRPFSRKAQPSYIPSHTKLYRTNQTIHNFERRLPINTRGACSIRSLNSAPLRDLSKCKCYYRSKAEQRPTIFHARSLPPLG